MADIEKVIDGLERVRYWNIEIEIDNAIQTIRELQKQIPKWHKVADGDLPTENKAVLCRAKSTTIASGNTYMVGSYDRGFWFLQTEEIGHHYFPIRDYEVIAWTELPEFEGVE